MAEILNTWFCTSFITQEFLEHEKRQAQIMKMPFKPWERTVSKEDMDGILAGYRNGKKKMISW